MANSSGYEYDVFLSFKGKDTRSGFTNFLYTSMKDVGIRVYKDDKELPKGEKFGPKLLQAINQSEISIPIFSEGYASSVWCLKELVQMIECQKIREQKIMPIFYDVAPSEVRYQTGGYGEAFLLHANKKRYDEETLREWKAALTTVGDLNGWDLQSMPNREEGEIAKAITDEVFNKLKKAYLVVSDNLVNLDHHVDKIMEEIGPRSETRIVGIHGMGGIGKTTIAKMVYNRLSNDFKDCCFLSDIRETSKLKGIECLQHQLICDILKRKWSDIRNIDEGMKTIKGRLSNKRVLLLLDDVEEKNHIDALVGKRDWFGKGSKLIITTRRQDVLSVPRVDWTYEVNGMNDYMSLQLFSKHAFMRDSPLVEYVDQSYRAIGIARGLPLALEIIGSLLSCIEKEHWDHILDKLEDIPPAEVQKKLKISFEALDIRQRHIFLDIACFFIGYDKDIVIHLWEKSTFYPEEAMVVLQNMSLIKIGKHNKVWMHDQLRDLGREIVRQESVGKIEKQRLVWDPKKGLNLLKRHEGNKEVEALRLKFDHQHRFTYEDFRSLPHLMFLEVEDSKEDFWVEKMLLWGKWLSNVLLTNIFRKNSNLLPQLRWLSWHNIRPTFKITNFSMEDVVILDLSRNEIMDDWKGWSHMKVIKNLKVLDLTCCYRLARNPNFSAHSNLERLILRECISLIEIDRSICQLKHLVFLDLSYCWKLRRLPDELGQNLASLKYLYLSCCSCLERLPHTIGNLKSLTKLDISSTCIKELPDSIRKLKNLKVVDMLHTRIRKGHDAFWMMEKLEQLEASSTEYYFNPVEVEIGNCIYGNKSLRILKLKKMTVYAPPRLPESLTILHLDVLRMDVFPDLSNLTNLKELHLRFSPTGVVEDLMPRWIGNLSKLESLSLIFLCETTSPTDISLPPLLRSPHISLERLSDLKNLSSLNISGTAVTEIQGLGCLENLRDLYLSSLKQVQILPDLSNLNKLRRLKVSECHHLVEVQGELPQSLQSLHINNCHSLRKLPNLPSLMSMKDVMIFNCEELNVEAFLEQESNSEREDDK